MIVYLSRALTRLVALIALPLLGVAALGFAVAAIAGEDASRSAARSTHLTSAWHDVGTFLARTAPQGDTVVVVSGVGAVVLGLVLVLGALAPARERELHLKSDQTDLGIRKRALRNALKDRIERGHVLGTTDVRVRLRPRRRRVGGRLRIVVTQTPRGDKKQIAAAYAAKARPLADAFALRTRVFSAVGKSRSGRTE